MCTVSTVGVSLHSMNTLEIRVLVIVVGFKLRSLHSTATRLVLDCNQTLPTVHGR